MKHTNQKYPPAQGSKHKMQILLLRMFIYGDAMSAQPARCRSCHSPKACADSVQHLALSLLVPKVSPTTFWLFSQAAGPLTDKQCWLQACLPLKDRHRYFKYFPNLVFSCKQLLALSGMLLCGRMGDSMWDGQRSPQHPRVAGGRPPMLLGPCCPIRILCLSP